MIIFIYHLNINNNLYIIKSIIKHELIHCIQAYAHDNIDYRLPIYSKRNTINYGDLNIFNLSDRLFNKLTGWIKYLNDSEQNAYINGGVEYLKNEYSNEVKQPLHRNQIVDMIISTYGLNHLDEFEQCVNEIENANYNDLVILGYYMQLHHYLNDIFTVDYCKKHINDNFIDTTKIKNAYYHYFIEYRKKLFNAILYNI